MSTAQDAEAQTPPLPDATYKVDSAQRTAYVASASVPSKANCSEAAGMT